MSPACLCMDVKNWSTDLLQISSPQCAYSCCPVLTTRGWEGFLCAGLGLGHQNQQTLRNPWSPFKSSEGVESGWTVKFGRACQRFMPIRLPWEKDDTVYLRHVIRNHRKGRPWKTQKVTWKLLWWTSGYVYFGREKFLSCSRYTEKLNGSGEGCSRFLLAGTHGSSTAMIPSSGFLLNLFWWEDELSNW